jgi:hypothetical protein
MVGSLAPLGDTVKRLLRRTAKDPGEFNPLSYFPQALDARLAFSFLRRMPKGVARRAGGLPIEQLIACLRSLSRMHVEAYLSRETRLWLGCFGFLLLPSARFKSSLAGYLSHELPGLAPEARQSMVEKFLRTLWPPARTGFSEFDRSSIHRYMTASTAFNFVEGEEAILFDSLFAPLDLESWLTSLDVDALGSDDTPRGVLFEEWVRVQVDRGLGARPLAPLQGLRVRTGSGDELTDIDVVAALPPWLLLIQCKNRVMKDASSAEFVGEFRLG